MMAATVLGGVAIWLMLPRASLRGRMTGMALGAIALGLLVSQVPRMGEWVADGLFFLLAGVTVVAAVATVTLCNPVYSAIWFGLSLLGTAALFLFQGAQFLAVATVVVYAGAILVTFLFVLMLANPSGRAPYDRVSWEALISAASGVVIVGILSMTVGSVLADPDGPATAVRVSEADRAAHVLADEHTLKIGTELFGRHLIAVEVAGTLLLAALVGAAIIVAQAKKSENDPQPTPNAQRRMTNDQ
jgi:NADH-quinone oxidoreductase subunit J